jgi:tetratricopeptide (TPR) repeat protein
MHPDVPTPWIDDPADVCAPFQLDLSCLVDGELEGDAARRAIAHLEACPGCREFFEDARRQVRAHRELADPTQLLDKVELLLGSAEGEVERIELVEKLVTVFYKLGKAYILSTLDPRARVQVFEKAVQVGAYQAEGRGFVDGVLERGRSDLAGLDWAGARGMLNGKLERIAKPLDKGRRLLEEALAIDPTHEEARFYVAYAEKLEGKLLRAAQGFRQLFRTAIDPVNRAHAAVQLGKLHADQGDHERAIACYRWVRMSGLADEDERFFVVRFNIGINYAQLEKPQRALAAFRELLDRHPGRAREIAELFERSPGTRQVIDHQPGFAEALLARCPELFDVQSDESNASGWEEGR